MNILVQTSDMSGMFQILCEQKLSADVSVRRYTPCVSVSVCSLCRSTGSAAVTTNVVSPNSSVWRRVCSLRCRERTPCDSWHRTVFFIQPVEAVTLKHRNSQFVRANTWAVVQGTEDHKTQLFGYKQMSVRFVQYAFCSLYFNYNIYGYIINK